MSTLPTGDQSAAFGGAQLREGRLPLRLQHHEASAVSRRAAELAWAGSVPVELSDDELARLGSPRTARCNPVDLGGYQGRAGRRLDADDVEEAYAARRPFRG